MLCSVTLILAYGQHTLYAHIASRCGMIQQVPLQFSQKPCARHMLLGAEEALGGTHRGGAQGWGHKHYLLWGACCR